MQLTDGHIRRVLDRTVRLQAEPFGGVTVAGYHYLYGEANRQDITVLLDGNGVDEVFLGYQKYHAAAVRLANDDSEWISLGAAYRDFWQSDPPSRGAIDFKQQSIDGSDGARPQAVADFLRSRATILPAPDFSGQFADPVWAIAAADFLSARFRVACVSMTECQWDIPRSCVCPFLIIAWSSLVSLCRASSC